MNDFTMEPLTYSDYEHLFTVIDANRSHLRRFLPWPDKTKTAADTRAFLKLVAESVRRGKSIYYKLYYHALLCGIIDAHFFGKGNKTAEISFWVAEKYCRRGICTNACLNILSKLKINGLSTAFIVCEAANIASIRVARKLGFRCIGVSIGSSPVTKHFICFSLEL